MDRRSTRPRFNASPEHPLERVAVLRRTIGASLERIWENVLDWEHLPWLHRGSFVRIELEGSGDWGWRARADLAGEPVRSIVTELVLERSARRYVARTLEGIGTGTEIWTSLTPQSGRSTDIEVEFRVPGVVDSMRDVIERTYLDLYTRLWDEDEQMMQARQARLDELAASSPKAPVERVALGAAQALESQLPLHVDTPNGRFRIVRIDGELWAHSTLCPHMLGPLEGDDDEGVPPGEVRCPWHGHRFDIRSGARTNGRVGRLCAAPRVEIDARTQQASLRFGSD